MGLAALRRGSNAIPAACLAMAAIGCAPEPVRDGFAETGELVALSGGNAGARAACHTCHGLQGQGDGNLTPRLAGLDAGYLARQLIFFAEGQRTHEHMSWIARQLTADQRILVADYYAGMAPTPNLTLASVSLDCEPSAARLYHRGDPERGIEACATCHGDDARGVGAGNPALVGQPAPYVAQQLRAWRSGKRYGDPLDVMLRAARALEESEITPLAAYVSSIGDGSDRREHLAECLAPRRPDPRSGA